MSLYYILDDNDNPIPMENVLQWGKWLESNLDKKVVARTYFMDCLVSTVFLGINHRFGEGAPVLYETMMFRNGGKDLPEELEYYQQRYETKREALLGHEKAVKLAKAVLAKRKDSLIDDAVIRLLK